MTFLLYPLLLFQIINCQEEPLIDCSSNYYRDEDSVCQLCDDDACETVLQKEDTKYEACREFCSSKADPKQYETSIITRRPETKKPDFSNDTFTLMRELISFTFNKKTNLFDDRSLMRTISDADSDTTYDEYCQKYCSNNIQCPFNNVTTNGSDILQCNNWTWLFLQVFVIFVMVIVISTIFGVLIAFNYVKTKGLERVNSRWDFVKEVIVTVIGIGCFIRNHNGRPPSPNRSTRDALLNGGQRPGANDDDNGPTSYSRHSSGSTEIPLNHIGRPHSANRSTRDPLINGGQRAGAKDNDNGSTSCSSYYTGSTEIPL